MPERDRLQTFLYILMRDHLPTGVIEEVVRDHVEKVNATNRPVFSAGHLADYASELAGRIAEESH